MDQRFLGKQSDYTVFGHIPDALGKMYTIWSHILNKQLSSFPSLHKSDADLITAKDFMYIRDFAWDRKIWEPFYSQTSTNSLNAQIYDY